MADMIVINPFDFFLEPETETFPFTYEPKLKSDLAPYLAAETPGKTFAAYLAEIDHGPEQVIDFLVKLNQKLSSEIRYLIRMEPNVQSCEQTLTLGSGSCRDSAWLLVNILRHLGLAARFASGYLIQLAADVKSLDGPSGPEGRFHRFACLDRSLSAGGRLGVGAGPHLGPVCRRGAHSPGLLPGAPERRPHLRRGGRMRSGIQPRHEGAGACGKLPAPPGPIRRTCGPPSWPWATGWIGNWRRPTWRLTMGGEPTFVSIDDMDGDQWNTAALGEDKRIGCPNA